MNEEKPENTIRTIILCLLGFGLACYTQLVHLIEVPGLHFDEAWQGLFAHRILTTEGFYPLEAMNAYTSPIIHYYLAAVFHYFGPTLTAMRGSIAAMNLLALALISTWFWFVRERRAIIWFILLWALLPLSVHNHRFYIEVTSLHGLMLAILLWGIALWNRAPKFSFILIVGSIVIGSYAHILFITMFYTSIFILARSFPRQFRSPRNQAIMAITALMLLPIPIRMGIVLGKGAPFVLAAILLCTAIWAGIFPRWVRMELFWIRFPRRAMKLAPLIFVLSIPFLIIYATIFWNGFWPYAQATGKLQLLWFPINGLMFFVFAVIQVFRRKLKLFDPLKDYQTTITLGTTWGAFVTCFVLTNLIIFKQTPRYFMLPTILGMIWLAQRMVRYGSFRTNAIFALLFIAWNLFAFERYYVHQFQNYGARNSDIKLWIFNDSSRDFRPFQKVFNWAITKNCQNDMLWVEDDRFKLPIEFLRLTSPQPTGPCPWSKDDLFFSHIPNYDAYKNIKMDEFNVKPPVPNVKYLINYEDWGDLAFWLRR